MTKEEYWNKLMEKNPSFRNESVKVSTRSLKAIIFQAFEKGCEMGLKCDKKPQNEPKKTYLDSLNALFGIK